MRTVVKSSILKGFWALRYAQTHTNTRKYVQIRTISCKNAQIRVNSTKSTKRLHNLRSVGSTVKTANGFKINENRTNGSKIKHSGGVLGAWAKSQKAA